VASRAQVASSSSAPTTSPRSSSARSLLDLAATTFRALGAEPAAVRAEALRDGRADGARPVAPDRPAGLTPREAEILRLIAAGRSNREIAAKLFLSVRTVERHITNLYGKIDARGKADATAFAFAHDLAPPRGA
jgi:DNA-binding CsgD family transcriptional regulator